MTLRGDQIDTLDTADEAALDRVWDRVFREPGAPSPARRLRARLADIMLAWREADHPRDSHGRFGSGSGGKGGGGAATAASGWKPEMSAAEAEAWAQESAVQGPLFHGTRFADQIRAEGFNVERLGQNMHNGGMLGAGNYTTQMDFVAKSYAREGNGEVLELRVKVKRVAEWENIPLDGTHDKPIPRDQLEAHFLSQYVSIKTGQGWADSAEKMADREVGFGQPPGMKVRDLWKDKTPAQMQEYEAIVKRETFGSQFVERQVYLHNGYDAVGTKIPGMDGYFELAVLRNESIVVVKR